MLSKIAQFKQTENDLRQALLAVGSYKTLDTITVSDLVKQAQVSRGTFYLHHQDKPTFVATLEDEMLERFDQIITAQLPLLIHAKDDEQAVTKLITAVFEYVASQQQLCCFLFGEHGDATLLVRIHKLFTNRISGLFLSGQKGQANIPLEYAIRHVASSILNFMVIWLSEHPNMTATNATQLMLKFMRVPTMQLLKQDQ